MRGYRPVEGLFVAVKAMPFSSPCEASDLLSAANPPNNGLFSALSTEYAPPVSLDFLSCNLSLSDEKFKPEISSPRF
jgi:hypothetical protein